MSIKDKLYYRLVEKDNTIKRAYQGYVNENPERHKKHRIQSWLFLLSLIFQKRFCGRVAVASAPVSAGNRLIYPEAETAKRVPANKLVEELGQYDVVSFDIFDTLLFRACSDPKDLFVLIGNRLGIMKFKDIRAEAEKYARSITTKPYGEVDIYDIYDVVEQRCGLKKEVGIQAELQAEKDMCFANPYMKKVVEQLAAQGKRVIAISNMYLPQTIILELLHKCGYDQFDRNVYVSCDFQCSKHKGLLQSKVWEIIGRDKSVIHVGDNYNADFIGSRMAGWKSFYYKNVNEIGKPYRPANMSALGGSVYSGLVNAKLHSGAFERDPHYELGYAYGGILACNYCAWLNEYAKANKIDKLLFSGRDMYVVHEIYNKYYKQVDNDYILLSRFAAQRFSYKRFSEYFINTHIRARAGIKKLTIAEALAELELSQMCRYLPEYGLSEDDLFTMEEYPMVKRCLDDHKQEVLDLFAEERDAALAYYTPLVQGCQRVAIVDLGWQGTNALCLKYLLEENVPNLTVYSLLMCAAGQAFLGDSFSGGITDAFCFSPEKNPELIKNFRTSTSVGRFPCELLFTSLGGSLKRFRVDTGTGVVPEFIVNENRNVEQLKCVMSGIRDYAGDYNRLGCTNVEIRYSGFESILPLNKLAANPKYIKRLMDNNEANPWIGTMTHKEASNIANILK